MFYRKVNDGLREKVHWVSKISRRSNGSITSIQSGDVVNDRAELLEIVGV